jgi:hypothetical protein
LEDDEAKLPQEFRARCRELKLSLRAVLPTSEGSRQSVRLDLLEHAASVQRRRIASLPKASLTALPTSAGLLQPPGTPTWLSRQAAAQQDWESPLPPSSSMPPLGPSLPQQRPMARVRQTTSSRRVVFTEASPVSTAVAPRTAVAVTPAKATAAADSIATRLDCPSPLQTPPTAAPPQQLALGVQIPLKLGAPAMSSAPERPVNQPPPSNNGSQPVKHSADFGRSNTAITGGARPTTTSSTSGGGGGKRGSRAPSTASPSIYDPQPTFQRMHTSTRTREKENSMFR